MERVVLRWFRPRARRRPKEATWGCANSVACSAEFDNLPIASLRHPAHACLATAGECTRWMPTSGLVPSALSTTAAMQSSALLALSCLTSPKPKAWLRAPSAALSAASAPSNPTLPSATVRNRRHPVATIVPLRPGAVGLALVSAPGVHPSSPMRPLMQRGILYAATMMALLYSTLHKPMMRRKTRSRVRSAFVVVCSVHARRPLTLWW